MLYNTIKEPDQEYHNNNIFNGGKFLSSHALINFIKSPAVYKQKLTGLMPQKDSDAYKTGRAAHCRILEGKEEYQRRYVFGSPINPKTEKPYGQQTEKYKAWKAEHEAEGREVISDSDDTLIEFMASGVNFHPEAMEALQHGEAEAVARAKYCGMDCQIKIDWLKDLAIVDLKTCREIDRFQYDFFKYRYHNQLSFYQKVFESFAGVRLPVYVLAVEKQSPYTAAYYQVEQSILDKAQRENENAINELRECMITGIWPTRYEGVQSIGAK